MEIKFELNDYTAVFTTLAILVSLILWYTNRTFQRILDRIILGYLAKRAVTPGNKLPVANEKKEEKSAQVPEKLEVAVATPQGPEGKDPVPPKSGSGANVDNGTLSLLMSRFPNIAQFCSQTEECERFLEEVLSRLEQSIMLAGLGGIQAWLSTRCKWGPHGSDRGAWCDLDGKIEKMRCTAATCFAKFCMGQAPCVQKKEVFVGTCQMIMKITEESECAMIRRYFDQYDETPDYFLVGNLMYHECVVKVNASEKKACVWDYGIEIDAPSSALAALPVIAFKFHLNADYRSVEFGNYTVPLGQWFTTCPEINHPSLVKITKPYLAEHNNQMYADRYGLRMSHGTACEGDEQFTVYLSGTAMNNGNPCPGVGTARCLRRSFGSRVKIVAFEYSLQSGGLKDPVFDEVNTIKQFHGKKKYLKDEVIGRVKRILEENKTAYFISTFDVEIDLLTEAKEGCNEEWCERVLIPTAEVLESTEKPTVDVIQKHFGFSCPKYLNVDDETDKEDIKRFCQKYGYPVLAKGKKFGCARVGSHKAVKGIAKSYKKKWGVECFLSEVINGYEKSYMFSSYKGKLLGAIEMRKDMVTKEGKCWGVHLEPLSMKAMNNLRAMCAETKWTGGGEIEFMENFSGVKFATDFNPRFPAWVFGGVHGGINLPGLLLSEITGCPCDDVTSLKLGGDFIRSVLEVPVNNKLVQPLFFASPDFNGCAGAVVAKAGGHPSRFSEIAELSQETLHEDDAEEEVESDTESEIDDNDIWVLDANSFEKTTQYLMNEDVLNKTIDDITQFTKKLQSTTGLETMVGLSVKTQPHDTVIQAAKNAGWFGEAISQAEVQKCLDNGYPASEIIVNGPLKNWPAELPRTGLKAWFADSLEDFDRLINEYPAEYIGFRVTPHNIPSRFGCPIELWREMKDRLDKVKEENNDQKIGIHFHFAQSKIGSTAWFGMARGVMRMVSFMCPGVNLLDLGGGWGPGDLILHETQMTELLNFAKARFANLTNICFEPGKSISQSAGGMVTKVLEFRGSTAQQRDVKKPGEFHGSNKNAVVDGFIGDFGVFNLHKHPLFYHSAISIKNEDIKVRAATEEDVSYIVKSAVSQRLCAEGDVEVFKQMLSEEKSVHYSSWFIAELDSKIVGCVLGFHLEGELSLEMECNSSIVDMINEVGQTQRRGLHLMCMDASSEDVYASLLKAALDFGVKLKDNNCYIVTETVSTELFEEFGFQEVGEHEGSFQLLQRKYWKPLRQGKDQILGRICMEFDQFGWVSLPDDLKVDDLILIRECGAYDMTMSYLFGDAKQRDIKSC
jgi:carbamoyl-phosphate synthase large subunit